MNKLSGNHQTISSLSVPSNPGWPYFDIKTGKPEINKLDKWYWKQQKEHKPGEDLNEIRNIRAIRIPKNIIDQIVAHPNSISLFYYLAAKPLYLSGRIHKQGDKAAYKRLAEFFQISESGMRGHLNKLENIGLVSYSGDAIVLAGYKKFCSMFDCGIAQFRHKYYFYNNVEVKTLIKSVVLAENLKKQDYIVFEKLCYLYLNMPEREFVNEKTALVSDYLRQYNIDKDNTPPDQFRSRLRKVKPWVSKNIKKYMDLYEKIYEEQVKCRVDRKVSDTGNVYTLWREYLDPYSTLSCRSLAKLLNRKSKSTGLYQARKMFDAELITITRRWVYSDDQMTFEDLKYGTAAPGTCYNKFPKKVKRWSHERKDKYLINLSNILGMNFDLQLC